MDVRLPRLGEGADSGTVASIFVKEGDQVRKNQPVLELESEKAVASIPSPADGTVAKLHVKEGDEIKVGQLIFTLSGEGAVSAPAERERIVVEEAVSGDKNNGARKPSSTEIELPSVSAPPPMEGAVPPPGIPPAASPSVRKLAQELGIDLAKVRGSERGGRIVLEDLKSYIRGLEALATQAKGPGRAEQRPQRPAPEPVDYSRWGPVKKEKLSTLRRTIGTKMAEAWTTVPHVTQFDEADATAISSLLKKYGPRYRKKRAHLTLTGVVLKALVATLKKFPRFNASVDESAGELVLKEYYHIGIAVDTEQGLIVPVIRDVDRKSMLDLSRELAELAERTRSRKVSLEEMQGGTFTVSNQGGIGSGQFTPIINTPQLAVLGVGRGVVKPVVRKGRIVQRSLLPLGLSYDHRVIDGADAARFMVELVRALERVSEADVRV